MKKTNHNGCVFVECTCTLHHYFCSFQHPQKKFLKIHPEPLAILLEISITKVFFVKKMGMYILRMLMMVPLFTLCAPTKRI